MQLGEVLCIRLTLVVFCFGGGLYVKPSILLVKLVSEGQAGAAGLQSDLPVSVSIYLYSYSIHTQFQYQDSPDFSVESR